MPAHALENFDVEDLLSLSLEDLVDIRVSTGGLSQSTSATSASAITIIRQDQIELTPAKNLASLLEQHVPGLMLMEHSEGNKIGIRGLIAAENYKLLLLVNGKNITNMIYEGAIVELDLWDMADIERIEVVRGPGSVTYGTGAIAGVINIITKSASSNIPKASISLMNNQAYGSRGINMHYQKKLGMFKTYSFLSYRKTTGFEDPKYFQMTTNEPSDIRYLGFRSIDSNGPQDYLADGLDRPQIKGHFDMELGDDLNIWLRYSQSGQSHSFQTKRNEEDALGNPIKEVNPRHVGLRNFIASTNYNFEIDEHSNIQAHLTYDNQEYIRRNFRNPQYSVDSIENINQYAFSQERFVASALYSLTYQENLNIIAGYEYSRIGMHAPWGKSDDHIWVYEGLDFISSNTTSVYLDESDASLNQEPDTSDSVEVGDGLIFETHSQLLESTYQLSENTQFLYAHRIDVSDVSDTMFSPRFSVSQQLDENNIAVITTQRALRMMPLRAQYLAHRNGESSEHESIDSLEFSLTNTQFEHTSINTRAYYNQINAVGYDGEKLEFLSDIEIAGLEFDVRYKTSKTEVSVNHAYLYLIDMDMNDSLKNGSSRNNISFADYYYITKSNGGASIPLLLTSEGNGLNNWSSNSTKLLLTNYFFERRLRTHINTQIYWDYEGAYDEMYMYQNAYDNFDTSTLSSADLAIFNTQKAEFEKERALLEDEDAYKYDVSVNGSIAYDWQIDQDHQFSLALYADNIFSTKKRYYVSTGSNQDYPSRLKYAEEPRTVGINLTLSFK